MKEDVIEEVDVVLCKGLLDQLLLLQYPSRPANRSYDGNQVLIAKIKPRQKKLEIHIGLNTCSQNYDCNKAEQIALNTDGANPVYGPNTTYFNSSKMDKLVVTSTKAVNSSSSGCYAIGSLSQGKFYITPVNSALQMRPSFEYLDRSYALGHVDDDIVKEEEETETVTVKFLGPNAEKAKKARELSYIYLHQKSEAEPWIIANYYPFSSQQSKIVFEKLRCSVSQSDEVVSQHEEYCILSLIPGCLLQSQICSGRKLFVFNTSQLSTSPTLADQLRSYMLNAYVSKFDDVMKVLPSGQSINAERLLQQISVLVQGCWVVKSDILYHKESASPYSGICSEMLIRARDYILWSFTKSEYVTTNDVLSVIRVPNEDVTAILSQIAKKVCNKGWEFRYCFDKEFVESHPNIVQRQEMLWDVRYKQLVRDLRLGQMVIDMPSKRSFPPPPSPKERIHFKYRESFSGDDTEESGAESSSSEKIDAECNKGHIFRRTSSLKKRSVVTHVKNGPRTRHPSASSFDISSTFLTAIPLLEAKSELLTHVRDVLYERFCLRLSDLKDSINDSSLSCITQRNDCEGLLEEALSEIGAQRLKNKWPQNTQPAILYAFTKFGTPLDRYRDALLDLFTSTARSRPNCLKKKIEDENGQIVSDAICKQIFEEYCLYKAGYYYLKGTIAPDF